MDNTQRITLDIRDNQTYEQIYTKQYNKGFSIEFEITKDGEPFNLSGCTASFEMKKPDKTVVWCNCSIMDNILFIDVTEQMTAVSGKAEFQITLNQGEILITTVTGAMKIDKSVIQNGDVNSSSDVSIVNEVLLEIKEVKQLVAEAKTYMESAETSASIASTSASNAKTSETNAKTSETNSTQNMATTKSYMELASDFASLALESAQSASNSANSAELSKENAIQSEINAKISETNSASSATSAQNYAVGDTDSAKYYYEQSKSISESFSGALRPMGTVIFTNLPNISSTSEGDMYNISDEFTTTDEFKEGSGNVIPAGSNIYKTTDGYWDVLAGSPVTGVKGDLESTYRRGNINITPDNIGALATDGDSSDNIITFESGDEEGDTFVEVPTMASGETHKSLFAKISTMFKNVRYLFKMLGSTDISSVGDGTVTGALRNVAYFNAKDKYITGYNASTGVISGNQIVSGNEPTNETVIKNHDNVLNTMATAINNSNISISELNNNLNTKQDAITGGATTITGSNLTANRALISNANGKVAVSGTSATELGYVKGVTSAIQTQLNAKVATNTNANLKAIDLTDSKPNIDFHFGNGTSEYDVRLWNESSGWLQCTGGFQVKKRLQIDDNVIYAPHSINFFCSTATSTGIPIYAKSFNQNSSKRIKENVIEMTEDEAVKLLNVEVVGFDYIESFGGDKDQFGVIAEDVEKIIPYVVAIPEGYDENKSLEENEGKVPSVDYSKFVPYLIKMVQMQQKEIETLKNKVS